MGRAPCCDKTKVKKGPWSPEEDDRLKSYIERHGTGGNWIALPHKIGLKRCGKSCRLRWLNYLRPNIKHGGFTEDEDNLICSLYITIGSRWSIIAAQLPGRTDNDIKNYWNTKLKKKLLGKQRRDQQPRKQLQTTEKSISQYFSLYPPPPQPVSAPPLLVEENQLHDSNSINNILPMPQFEPNDQNFETFHCISDFSCSQNHEDAVINFPAFDGVGSFFSAVDTISSVSQDNSSWGDISSVVYPCVNLTDYEICQTP